MKATILVSLLSATALAGSGQRNINPALREELSHVLAADQGIREYLVGNPTELRRDTLSELLQIPKDSLNRYGWMIMQDIDRKNTERVERIIARYGYPGKSIVGEPANTAVFFVIQHSSKIHQYLPLIEQAAKNDELPFKYYAMMLDRKLSNEGKEQIYGTQVSVKEITDPSTGSKKKFQYVVPIKDARNVNARRKEAGFDTTVEENAIRLGTIYRPYTYQELEKITGEKK
ncbi:MAG: hypothetical protein J7599_20720 [Niabella sp.]|nr:hypothetical protein [Niabella sp.]